jgi:hypothetical protein
MARSRTLVLGVLAGIAGALAGCDSLLGLGNYSAVPCAEDCGVDGSAGDVDGGADATLDAADASDASDADATSDADAAFEAGPISDAPPDAPPVIAAWARWPMPNPDAALYPGSDASLPNPMSYDAGADGGSPTVYDAVTGLTWWRTALTSIGSLQAAVAACTGLGVGFHVPTRIQLVSLIDFTRQNPTLNASVFSGVTSTAFWTASVARTSAGTNGFTWTVNFGSGEVSNSQSGAAVLCVSGGP